MNDECRFCGTEIIEAGHFKQGYCIKRLKQEISKKYNEWRLLFSKVELWEILTEVEGDGQ